MFRSALGDKFLSAHSSERFLSWTDHTLGSVRLFQSFDNGEARSGLLDGKRSARAVHTRLSDSDAAFTIHMNDVEIVDPEIFDLRQSLGIPYWWRLDDVIGTLSSRGSGIGYHAGHEDGFIVQLVGSRRWRVWSECCTPAYYRRELLSPSPGANPVIHRPDATADLLLDVELNAGDVLYIPPFFPHEGATLATSVSLSVAWKGLGPISFIPRSLYSAILPSDGLVGEAGAEICLFQEREVAKIALAHWEKATLAVIREAEREYARPLIRKSIENHIHLLSERYCCS